MGRFLLRTKTAADADSIASIVVAGWRAAYRDILDAAFIDSSRFEDGRREQWRDSGASEPASDPKVVVAEDSGVVVGWVSFGSPRQPKTDPGIGELWGLYVDPVQWGSGAATKLAGRVLKDLADSGFHECRLWVLEENPRARAFYEKCGWTYTGASRLRDFGEAGKAIEVEMSVGLAPGIETSSHHLKP